MLLGLAIGHRFGSSISSGALSLLAGDDGLALDFTDDTWFDTTGFYGSAAIVGGGSQDGYNTSPDATAASLLTYTAPSPKMTMGPAGLLQFQAHNLYLNSASPANQSITVLSGMTYAVTITGTVSVTASGAATGTWTAGTQTFTAATGTLTFGSTSGAGTVHVRRTPSDSTYLATAGTIRYSLPYQWTSAGVLEGIRVEEARTNRQTYSQDFSNAVYALAGGIKAFGAGSVVNDAAAPDGTTTADFICETADTFGHYFIGVIESDAAQKTWSCFVKANGREFVRIQIGASALSTGVYIVVNLSNGAVGSVTDLGGGYTAGAGGAVSLGNGWYRVYITATTPASAHTGYIALATSIAGDFTYSGDGTSGVYVWGAQMETGACATSYIPTNSATVTRAADNISLAATAFPTVNASQTFFAEVRFDAGQVFANNRIIGCPAALPAPLYAASSTLLRAFDGVDIGSHTTSDMTAAFRKVGIAGDAVDSSLTAIGAAVTALTDVEMATITILRIGSDGGVVSFLNGVVAKIMYLPRRMTDADLVTLTTP